jgi:hypothetical protein
LKELKKIWKKESPVFKEEYKLYKKRISYLENEWDYYEKLRKSLSKNDFKNVNFYYSRLIKYHEKVKDTIAFEEYYNGAVYYYGFSKIKLYKFKEGLDVLSNIPENSYFYDLALDLANKVMNDSDGDGYIDEWEILDGFNPMNPYSHP